MNERKELESLCLYLVPGSNLKMQMAYIKALMALVERADPDYVIDIGTNLGTSCMAMTSMMHLMGKSESYVATVDIHHGLWKRSISRVGSVFKTHGIDMDKIKSYERNFKGIHPASFVPSGRGMIFFDIHDFEDGSEERNSTKFIHEWLPLVEDAIVAFHDVTPCEKGWQRPKEWGEVKGAAVVECWTGQSYRGFGEVATLMEYLNEHEIVPQPILGTSIVWFKVKDGMPC